MKAKRNLAKKSKALDLSQPTAEKAISPTRSKMHLSPTLQNDARSNRAFRFAEMLGKHDKNTFFLRVYPGLDPSHAGGELVTLVKVCEKDNAEYLVRFDELLPSPLAFRRGDDAAKVAAAKSLIEQTGGVSALSTAFQKFSK